MIRNQAKKVVSTKSKKAPAQNSIAPLEKAPPQMIYKEKPTTPEGCQALARNMFRNVQTGGRSSMFNTYVRNCRRAGIEPNEAGFGRALQKLFLPRK
ncbi:MAG: hypothetical protein WCW13_04805 [archaeon]|jgi:hypothetical protein